MAITKFERWKISEKNSDDNTKLEQHIQDKPVYENETLATRMLYDKVHELADNANLISIASNTTISFGALTSTTAKGKTTYSVTLTVTDTSGKSPVSKSTKLTLS
jgi:hypothetical protein